MEAGGTFITISGLDGSGKTTVQHRMKVILKELTKKEIICMDGLKPLKYTNMLRKYASQENQDVFELFGKISLFSFALSLIDNYVNIIRPALEQGKIVITHRNDMCCKVYTRLRDYDNSALPILNELLKSYPKADLHLYCNADVDTVMGRIEERKKGGYTPSINEDYENLTKAEVYYNELLSTDYSYVKLFDTSGSEIHTLDQAVRDMLIRKFGRRL